MGLLNTLKVHSGCPKCESNAAERLIGGLTTKVKTAETDATERLFGALLAEDEGADPGYDCPLGDYVGACILHSLRHMTLAHPEHAETRQALRNYAQDMTATGVWTDYQDLEVTISAAGVFPNYHSSAYLKMAEQLGLKLPCRVSTPLPSREVILDPAQLQQFDNDVKNSIYEAGLQLNDWTSSSSLSFFCSELVTTPFLTRDMAVADPDAISGFRFNPESTAGNIRKRNRVLTPAEATIATPEPVKWPRLSISPEDSLRCYRMNTNLAGDGSGMIETNAMLRLLQAGGVDTSDDIGDIFAVYVVGTNPEYSFKGQFNVIDKSRFLRHDPYNGNRIPIDVDLILDGEDFNQDLFNDNFGLLKIIPKRHKTNKRHFIVEGLFHQEVVSRFIDPAEAARVQERIAAKLDLDAYQSIKQGNHDHRFERAYPETTAEDYNWDLALAELRNQPIVDAAAEAYKASGRSPFANSNVMTRIAGKYARSWASAQQRKAPLPTFVVSGEHTNLMHPLYAAAPQPDEGYLRIIWHPRRRDQILGVGLHPEVLRRESETLDTPDHDDTVYLIFLEAENGQIEALVLRLPSSVDSGLCQRVYPADARRLRRLGYHFYRKQKGHRHPGLYTLDAEGNPLVPNRLSARDFPEDQIPVWTTNPEEALVTTLCRLEQNRPLMGKICNAVHGLDYNGQYDPDRHKMNFSEQVIDPVQKATKDPLPVSDLLYADLYRAALAGKRFDPCILERLLPGMQEIHDANPDYADSAQTVADIVKPNMKCAPHHAKLKEAMKQGVKYLEDRLLEYHLMANGPMRWLTKMDFPRSLTDPVLRAHKARSRIWGAAMGEHNRIKYHTTGYYPDRLAQCQIILDKAAADEAKVVQQAYQTVLRNQADSYKPGQFMAFWHLLDLTAHNRFQYDRDTGRTKYKPASSHALDANLPLEERVAFYRHGRTAPTAIFQVKGEQRPLYRGARCRLVKKLPRQGPADCAYRLETPVKGEVFGFVPKFEGQHYEALELRCLGYMPNYWPDRYEKIEPDTQPDYRSRQGQQDNDWDDPELDQRSQVLWDDDDDDTVEYRPVDQAADYLVAFEVLL